MRDLAAGAALGLMLPMLVATSAAAHKLKVFAFADGDVIRGSVYFGGNARAQGAQVRVYAPDGTLIAETASDGEGRFTVAVGPRVDHRVVADSGDGHVAEHVVAASELPGSATPAPGTILPSPTPDASPAAAPGLTAAEIEAVVDRAVTRQVAPLREQLAAFEEEVRLRDVLGGLGWIIGITFLGAWLLARRRAA